jgi:hypothetical protein
MKFPWDKNSIINVLKKEDDNKIQEKLEHITKGIQKIMKK